MTADSKFYIGKHGMKYVSYRPWAIMEPTKYGPKIFDIFYTEEQAVTAARARLQQASANMGGVGQQQVESQIAGLTTQLLNNQYQYGLQVMQIGDNIALGAINTQLQLDNQLAAANKSFYSSLANLVAGSPSYVQGMVPVTPAKV